MAKATRSMPEVRTCLTATEVGTHRAEICRTLARYAPRWRAEGWSFVGRSPRIRVAVRVPFKRPHASSPVGPIPLPRGLGGTLKPMVVASYSQAGDAHRVGLTAGGAGQGSVREALAPGVPLFISDTRRRIGFAGVVRCRGRLHILTCAHGFERDDEELFVDGDDEPVAVLTVNLLAKVPRIDGALCELTDHGRELLRASRRAPTWLRAVHPPEPGDNDRPAVFWPTHSGHGVPFEENVRSFSACDRFDLLFHGRGPRCEFVEVPFRSFDGDSGSLLSFAGAAYALCTGHIDSVSYLTPLAAVLARLSNQGQVRLWHPDDGFSS